MMYQIKNYDKLYRPKDTKGKDLVNATYVKLPAKPLGKGLKKLLKDKKGIQVFGVWCLLLQDATLQKIEHRGKLLNHQDKEARVDEIAEAISLDKQVPLVKYALSLLVSMGWVQSVQGTEEVRSDYGVDTEEVRPKCSVVESSVEKSRVRDSDIQIFEKARDLYPGTKLGPEKEFENFTKKYPDTWKQILPLLEAAVAAQIQRRAGMKERGEFVPAWKHFKTWINNGCWTEEGEAPPQDVKRDCACGCGKEAKQYAGNVWYASKECRQKLLGW